MAWMRKKGARGVTTVERAVYGMLRIAALSRQLHSAGLSGLSLSCLTSLLKPGPPPETTPSRRPDCHCDPRAPLGSAPPFTRDLAPDSLCLSTPSLRHIHTHQRALLSLGSCSKHKSGKKSSGDRSRNTGLKLRSCVLTPDAALRY